MDTFQVIAAQRDTRNYKEDPLPDGLENRILEAGRVTGSGMNRQERRFVVLSEETQKKAAAFVTRPRNLETGRLAIVIVTDGQGSFTDFDIARAAQNMMLTAWNEGVASCPNAVKDAEGYSSLLGLGDGERIATTITFGFPEHGRTPESRSAAEWLEKADRLPLDEVVSRL